MAVSIENSLLLQKNVNGVKNVNIVDFILGNHFTINGIFMSFIVAILISILNILMEKLVLNTILGKENE